MDHVATSSGSNVGNEFTKDFTATQGFESKEELVSWAQEVGSSKDITVVVLKSDSGNGVKKARVTLGCEKSGKPNLQNRKRVMKGGRRLTGTKKCGCPFLLKGKELAAGNGWQLKVVDGKHNHEAEDTGKKQGHSFEGRLSPEEKKLVADLYKAEMKPNDILIQLKKRNKRNKSTVRTIHNECQRLKRLMRKHILVGSSLMQKSMSKAEECNFIMDQRISPKMESVLEVFWTHPRCLELLLAFPTVLIVVQPPKNCWATFRILGVTSTDTHFHVGWALLDSIDRNSCEWALSSLRDVMNENNIDMPDIVILKLWGENRTQIKAINNVFSTANLLFDVSPHFLPKKLISHMPWSRLVFSTTEADFERNLRERQTIPAFADWFSGFSPFKEMFVKAWTDKVMHFGSTERNYSVLSSFGTAYILITVICGASEKVEGQMVIDGVWKDLQKVIESEHADVNDKLKASLGKKYDDKFQLPELKELHGTISIHALELIRVRTILAREIKYAEKCSCVIRSTHGLPCEHEIADYMRKDLPISPACINSYWKKLDLKPSRKTGLRVVDVCPPVLETHILEIVDVPRDGHCGFRVIASMLGINDHDGRPGWAKVRQDLQNELNFKSDHYTHLFGSKEEVDHLLNRLTYSQVTCPEKEHWMMMPEMGHLIASCYGVVLMHLSSVQSFTFFPLHIQPTPAVRTEEVVIGFCDEHFVQVLIKEEHKNTHPMPPPAPLLTKKYPSDLDIHHKQRSTEWATRYKPRLTQFHELITE